jgi:hypothetical protein
MPAFFAADCSWQRDSDLGPWQARGARLGDEPFDQRVRAFYQFAAEAIATQRLASSMLLAQGAHKRGELFPGPESFARWSGCGCSVASTVADRRILQQSDMLDL